MDASEIGLCIPTLNPGRWIDRLVPALESQRVRPERLLVIDSSSDDGSVERFSEIGAEVLTIPREHFDHGGTRNEAVRRLGTDVVIFMTQDAVPADDSALLNLVMALDRRPHVALVYGRQLPSPGAGPLARANREFNYGPMAFERSCADVAVLGVRAAFCSNSFAAYRTSALAEIGGFPSPVVGSEDRWAAARLLQEGWSVAYEPDARVLHSHDYRLSQDVRRYFDIGVFQASESWFEDYLGRPETEGRRLLRAQIRSLREAGVRSGPLFVLAHAAAVWSGYRLGRLHRHLPLSWSAHLSAAPWYFRSRSHTGRTR